MNPKVQSQTQRTPLSKKNNQAKMTNGKSTFDGICPGIWISIKTPPMTTDPENAHSGQGTFPHSITHLP